MRHTRFRLPALLSGLALLLVGAPPAKADSVINIGVLAFDILIPPAGNSPGVNVFDIYNFTGDPDLSGFALPPDFPILDFVTLQNASLLFNGTGSPVTLPDIAPGQLDEGSAPQFSSDTLFTSALFNATLSNTTLQLSGGGTFTADPTITAVLIPGFGPNLLAGTDLVVLQATGTLSASPEPSSAALIALSLMAALALSPLWGRLATCGRLSIGLPVSNSNRLGPADRRLRRRMASCAAVANPISPDPPLKYVR